jgi:hypothetical protein
MNLRLVLGLLILVFSIVIIPQTQAATARGKVTVTEAPQRVPLGAARRLFIVGYEGSVVVTPSRTADVTVKATKSFEGDDQTPASADVLHQLVIRTAITGDVVEVRAQLPPNASDWGRWVTGKHVPQARLEVSAPDTLSLEIYLNRGDVKVSRWRAPVVLTSEDGHHDLSDIAGDITARTMFGTLKIENIKGNVSVENFSAQIATTNVAGRLKLRTFSGETHLKKISGATVISTQKAPVVLQDTTGTLEVQTGVGAIHIADHKGSLVGHSDSGSISAQIAGAVDARLRSNTGNLILSVPRDSHANVVLASSKGNLTAPHSLDVKRTETGKVAKGELPGSAAGTVRMSSDGGDVTLKE